MGDGGEQFQKFAVLGQGQVARGRDAIGFEAVGAKLGGRDVAIPGMAAEIIGGVVVDDLFRVFQSGGGGPRLNCFAAACSTRTLLYF